MEKIFILDGLDCANCAAKIEEAVSKLDGVENISVSFMTQRMTFEIENEEKLKEIKDLIKKIESDVDIIEESYE
ncbi:MAG: heavy-metal-associated domain-containing protein [Firmicutes bacterium]|nr:heavy-metal-associated domain-containing protein [Bacillota bacterium]